VTPAPPIDPKRDQALAGSKWRERMIGAAFAFVLFVSSGLISPLISNVGDRISKYALPPKAPEPDLRVDIVSQDKERLKLVVKNFGNLASFVSYAIACPPRSGVVYEPDSWQHWNVDDLRTEPLDVQSLYIGHIRPYSVGCRNLGVTLHVVSGDRHVPGGGDSRILEFEAPDNFRYFGNLTNGPVVASGPLCPLVVSADNQSVPNIFPCWANNQDGNVVSGESK